MAFLINKYAPVPTNGSALSQAYFHLDILQNLAYNAKIKNISHYLFYGISGIGKKTLINFFLEMIYGPEIYKLEDVLITDNNEQKRKRETTKKKKKNEKVKKELRYKKSKYHIVIDNIRNYDKLSIQKILNHYIDRDAVSFDGKYDFKIVIINNLDTLSYSAQSSLRRIIEKNSTKCRFIMWATQLSSVIKPIRSRSICTRIPQPMPDEIALFLHDISLKQQLFFSYEKCLEIAKRNKCNIKFALWELDYIRTDTPIINNIDITKIPKNLIEINKDINIKYLNNNYNNIIMIIINNLMSNNLNLLEMCRLLIYDILVNNINPSQIIITIINFILHKKFIISDIDKCTILNIACKYEHRILKSNRYINHFEAILCRIFYIINKDKIDEITSNN